MGLTPAEMSNSTASSQSNSTDGLTITGLATSWPSALLKPDSLREFAEKLYPADAAWLQKMLKINSQSGIHTRAALPIWDSEIFTSPEPPTIEQVHALFDEHAPPLAAEASRKALAEARISAQEITHTVFVTATNAKCPGYDHLVAADLGISQSAERALLAGSGCAGGLAALRVAANMAYSATARGRPARILVVATELSSINLRAELDAAYKTGEVRIGAALFSDGAAAVVLCNDAGLASDGARLFGLADWAQHVAPSTYDLVSVSTGSEGFLVYLSKELPAAAAAGVKVPLARLTEGRELPKPEECDWALHAGGAAIIRAAQSSVGLPDYKLRASSDVYRSRGNTASVTVLAVLDRLRSMGEGTKDVYMCSFVPGLTVEMARLQRLC